MKKRHEELARCDTLMRSRFDRAGVRARLAFRHLYHDREEVTGFVEVAARGTGRPRRRTSGAA